jgi:hypothetical protein
MSAPSLQALLAVPYSPIREIGLLPISVPLTVATGALFARVFTSLNPVAGAIILGVHCLSGLAARVTASCFTAKSKYVYSAGILFSFVGVAALSDAVLKAAGFAAVGSVKAVLFVLGTSLAAGAVAGAVALPILATLYVLSRK